VLEREILMGDLGWFERVMGGSGFDRETFGYGRI
jgi:hypothetical protein